MTRCYLGIGANLGDRRATLARAVALLRETPGIRVPRVSSFHETEPVGGPPQGRFLNGVVELDTELTPRELLVVVKGVERRLGRVAGGPRWGPRSVDVDILVYGNRRVAEPDLEIPHPRWHERAFVLAPFVELAPALRHPILGRTVQDLWANQGREVGPTSEREGEDAAHPQRGGDAPGVGAVSGAGRDDRLRPHHGGFP